MELICDMEHQNVIRGFPTLLQFGHFLHKVVKNVVLSFPQKVGERVQIQQVNFFVQLLFLEFWERCSFLEMVDDHVLHNLDH